MSPTFRPITAADFEAVHRLELRIGEHDRVPYVTPLAMFEEWLTDPHLDMARDTRLAELDGVPIAWGQVWFRPSGTREERAYLAGAVDPAHRGRGIGSSLLGWQIDRARAILRGTGNDLPRHVRAMAFEFQASAMRLYARHGMEPVRYADELLRDLEDLPAPAPPPGVEIVRWDPARNEQARLAQNDAFADHWGSTPLDREAFEHMIQSFQTRLDLSFLAVEGGEVVGVCRNGYFPDDEPVTGRREGWIMQVSTPRAHRKRGIASALISASLAAFKAAGLTHSALGVDSENPTGAYHLYERLGYRPIRRSVTYEIGA